MLATLVGFGMGGAAHADGRGSCAGTGLAVVVNGTNDTPPPDIEPALDRYVRRGYRPYTLPYPATVWPLGRYSYDDNVRVAVPRLARVLDWYTTTCPGKAIALIGFSQGSRIVGDVVSAMGNGRPLPTARGMRTIEVPADRITVELYADPRREPVPGRPGAGVETLFPNTEVYPGLTMTGSRPGGFGHLAHRVVEVCIVGDPICDSVRPPDVALVPTLIVGVFRFSTRHTHYGPEPGRPAAVDPWTRAIDGTWMAPPPPLS